MSSSRSSKDGILNIDKPYDMTSMEVVRRIKRAAEIKRVGHAGTLDPIATGVVPVCIGQATRVMEYLVDSSKEYVGEIHLGVSTDTYDAQGEVTHEKDVSDVTRDRVEEVLSTFHGTVSQVPPMFSALKRDGKRLYELARQGVEVEREPRSVVVHDLKLVEWTPPVAKVWINCGKGFYMRSLAHDVGEALGGGGHLKSLVRTRTGPFELEDAVSLEEAQDSFEDGTWPDLLHRPDFVLTSMRSIIAGQQFQAMIQNGRALPSGVPISAERPEERIRAYSVDGKFLAIMRFDSALHHWQPEKVFNSS